jgi:hypothetical protein
MKGDIHTAWETAMSVYKGRTFYISCKGITKNTTDDFGQLTSTEYAIGIPYTVRGKLKSVVYKRQNIEARMTFSISLIFSGRVTYNGEEVYDRDLLYEILMNLSLTKLTQKVYDICPVLSKQIKLSQLFWWTYSPCPSGISLYSVLKIERLIANNIYPEEVRP